MKFPPRLERGRSQSKMVHLKARRAWARDESRKVPDQNHPTDAPHHPRHAAARHTEEQRDLQMRRVRAGVLRSIPGRIHRGHQGLDVRRHRFGMETLDSGCKLVVRRVLERKVRPGLK